MNIRDLYSAVDLVLSQIDFKSIWAGFHRFPFALYDDSTVYLSVGEIPVDNRFLGNTSIEYEGRLIAIWNNSRDADVVDTEELAANLTQAQSGRDELNRFIALRETRSGLIGDRIEQEYKAETIEGAAEYCGLQALKQVSREKYQHKVQQYCSIISVLSEKQFDIRRISYYVGALFLLFSDQYGFTVSPDLSSDTPFFNQTDYSGNASGITMETTRVQPVFESYMQGKIHTIDRFLSTHSRFEAST